MTLTTETIKQWRSDAENIARRSCEYETEYSAAEAILALTAELLANREAQPVGVVISRGNLAHVTDGDLELGTKLYTAPPAPAVPGIDELRLAFERAERESDDGFNLHKYGIGYEDEATQSRWESWNACRAAMLAQHVSGGYKLVPAEPTEDMIAAAMNCDDVSFNADETFCVNFGNIYAAMLAAAPEGDK
ncbi:TPA: hypothetical protein ACXJGQ_000126 [Serratia marcescens]